MSIEVETLIETYSILNQYIPNNHRQEAADHLMSSLVDMLDLQDLREVASAGTQLQKALKEYVVETDEEADDYDEDE